MLLFLCRHLFVELKQAFQAGFVRGKGVAWIAALHDIIKMRPANLLLVGHQLNLLHLDTHLREVIAGFSFAYKILNGLVDGL